MDVFRRGKVSREDLEEEMLKHRIVFSKERHGKGERPSSLRLTEIEPRVNKDKGISFLLEDKVKKCFLKLNNILTTKNLTLLATYDAYDTDKNGSLTVGEFERMLKRLDTSFTEEEILRVFNHLDTNSSKAIEFEELDRYYCKVNDLAESFTWFPELRKDKPDRRSI